MKDLKRYCLALDLINDPGLMSEYKAHHQRVWPEIERSLLDSGIEQAEIYAVGNRLFMILEVNDQFSFQRKKAMDDVNPVVEKWEGLMWKYQQALPMAKPGEKWVLMERIYSLVKA
jgi:L-rhamnose mutarotase